MKKTIAIIIGTRPEAVKLIPVYLQCLESDILNPVLVCTGQHEELVNQVFDFFGVTPDIQLKVMSTGDNLAVLTSKLFKQIDNAIAQIQPDLIMVQGDTCSAWVAAMVGFYHKIKVAHVEAGLRTWHKFNPFPEEIYRAQISKISDFNFTPTTLATDNLKKEGVSNIYQVGNTVVDMLQRCMTVINSRPHQYQMNKQVISDPSKKVVLITCHRRENIEKMGAIARAIGHLARENPEHLFLLPIHLNPKVRRELENNLGTFDNLQITDPLPYDKFIYYLLHAHLVLTDSGGVQEEAASAHVPFIVLRDVSERNEAINSGCGIIGGTDEDSIIAAFNKLSTQPELYQAMKAAVSPFGEGKAALHIIEILENKMGVRPKSTEKYQEVS